MSKLSDNTAGLIEILEILQSKSVSENVISDLDTIIEMQEYLINGKSTATI